MAEPEIKRVNFFDGQFLKAAELNDLSNYAVHMQRRLLFMLFVGQGGVVDTGASDLAVDVPTAGQKAIRVRAGMAIGRRIDIAEAHEIILHSDVSPINLTVASAAVPAPLQAHDTGIVTIHYEEVRSGGDDPTNKTRINETAVITVYRNATPPSDPAKPLVVLGKVAFDTMTVTSDQRQIAQINPGLVGGKPPPVKQKIFSITPKEAFQGSVVQIRIAGAKLDGASAISFDDRQISAQILAVDPSGTSLDASLTIPANVSASSMGFVVTTPAGLLNSKQSDNDPLAVIFTVVAIPQDIVILTTSESVGHPITLRGSNIRDAGLAPNQPAAGTSVSFVDPTTQAVLATAEGVLVAPDIGSTQQIQVKAPPAAKWNPQPAANSSLTVKVRITFKGASGTSGSVLRVNF
jgi:hypothetical protein